MKFICKTAEINPYMNENLEVTASDVIGFDPENDDLGMILGAFSSEEIFKKLRSEIVAYIVNDNDLFQEVIEYV